MSEIHLGDVDAETPLAAIVTMARRANPMVRVVYYVDLDAREFGIVGIEDDGLASDMRYATRAERDADLALVPVALPIVGELRLRLKDEGAGA